MEQKSALEIYTAQIGRYQMLSHEQELRLARQIQDGDKDARQKLVNANLRLVVRIARKYAPDTELLLDLIQEGSIGLMKAADKFSPRFAVHFSTYAYPWITQYILRYIQGKVPAIYLPPRKAEDVRRVRKARCYLQMTLGREPTLAEVAACLGVKEGAVREVLRYSFTCSSIHRRLGKGERCLHEDILVDDRFSMERTGFRNLVADDVRKMVDCLSKAERQVVCYRFGLGPSSAGPQSLRQVGKRVGCSAETVRNLELRALRFLREAALETMST